MKKKRNSLYPGNRKFRQGEVIQLPVAAIAGLNKPQKAVSDECKNQLEDLLVTIAFGTTEREIEVFSQDELVPCCKEGKVTLRNQPESGQVTVVGDNLVKFTPDANQRGQVCFEALIECRNSDHNTCRKICVDVQGCCEDQCHQLDGSGNAITVDASCQSQDECCTYQYLIVEGHDYAVIDRITGQLTFTPPSGQSARQYCIRVAACCGEIRCEYNVCFDCAACCSDVMINTPYCETFSFEPPECNLPCSGKKLTYMVIENPLYGNLTVKGNSIAEQVVQMIDPEKYEALPTFTYDPFPGYLGEDKAVIGIYACGELLCEFNAIITVGKCEDAEVLIEQPSCPHDDTFDIPVSTEVCRNGKLKIVSQSNPAMGSVTPSNGGLSATVKANFTGSNVVRVETSCGCDRCYTDITIVVDEPCADGYIRVAGICIQLCNDSVPCPDGYVCINGLCLPQCSEDTDCPEGWICIAGICFPPCGPNCPEGFECVGGYCLPICIDDQCPEGFVCVNGICLPDCTEAQCPEGWICIAGICYPPCGPDHPCPVGFNCVGGYCLPICIDGQCPEGFVCVNGVCLPDCTEAQCPEGWICIAGICYPPCGPDHPCPVGFNCVGGYCLPICLDDQCPEGFVCVNGQCLPICSDDNPCPPGWWCAGGICYPPCDEQNPCPIGFVCVGGYCWPICTDPTDENCCPDGLAYVAEYGACLPIAGDCGEIPSTPTKDAQGNVISCENLVKSISVSGVSFDGNNYSDIADLIAAVIAFYTDLGATSVTYNEATCDWSIEGIDVEAVVIDDPISQACFDGIDIDSLAILVQSSGGGAEDGTIGIDLSGLPTGTYLYDIVLGEVPPVPPTYPTVTISPYPDGTIITPTTNSLKTEPVSDPFWIGYSVTNIESGCNLILWYLSSTSDNLIYVGHTLETSDTKLRGSKLQRSMEASDIYYTRGIVPEANNIWPNDKGKEIVADLNSVVTKVARSQFIEISPDEMSDLERQQVLKNLGINFEDYDAELANTLLIAHPAAIYREKQPEKLKPRKPRKPRKKA